MRVAITKLRLLMAQACELAGIPPESVETVVAHFIEGELQGKPSHGVAKFCFESSFFAEREGSPRVVRDHGVFCVVDGRREVGPLSAAFAVDTAIERAREYGAGIVGVCNVQRYGVLAPWTERIARAGMLGLVMNTSRPDATVAGGRTPFLGVNPLSYAFPTEREPFVVDMSTTEAPMGVLWECRRNGTPLPADSFVDAEGEPTDDPNTASAALVFGGHKGFALSVLVQVLTGSLFGFPMGAEVVSTWTTGYAFLAIDPSLGGSQAHFAADNTRFVTTMQQALNRDGTPLRLPGRVSHARALAAERSGYVDIPDAVYQRLIHRASGNFASD